MAQSIPYRLYIRFQDEAHSLRVQAHNADPDLLVIKSKHPEAVDNLATLSGQSLGVVKAFKGSGNFITFVSKADLIAAVPKFLEKIAILTPNQVEDGADDAYSLPPGTDAGDGSGVDEPEDSDE